MTKAIILGCAGPALTPAERAFFQKADPLGFILFARNIENPDQARGLCADLRDAVGRADAPILIDQEGGRVARLRPPRWTDLPPMGLIGALAETDRAAGVTAAKLVGRIIAADCASIGVDVACAPVLDLVFPDAHDIVGDRSFGASPIIVAACGRGVLEGLAEGGVCGVVKHMPGHGRALSDSHLDLPVVDADAEDLADWDFRPFKALADAPMAMTAHIRYPALDADSPITLSVRGVEAVIRREIGFRGLLMSDDLCMKALTGPMEARAAGALAAGCDVVLHCDGRFDDAVAATSGARDMTGAATARLEAARAHVAQMTRHDDFDPSEGVAQLRDLLGPSWSVAA